MNVELSKNSFRLFWQCCLSQCCKTSIAPHSSLFRLKTQNIVGIGSITTTLNTEFSKRSAKSRFQISGLPMELLELWTLLCLLWPGVATSNKAKAKLFFTRLNFSQMAGFAGAVLFAVAVRAVQGRTKRDGRIVKDLDPLPPFRGRRFLPERGLLHQAASGFEYAFYFVPFE